MFAFKSARRNATLASTGGRGGCGGPRETWHTRSYWPTSLLDGSLSTMMIDDSKTHSLSGCAADTSVRYR